MQHFLLAFRGPAQRGGPQAVNSERSEELRRANSLRPSILIQRGPRTAQAGWGWQEEMRTLGTVQLPTEAFMAVLKLDEE